MRLVRHATLVVLTACAPAASPAPEQPSIVVEPATGGWVEAREAQVTLSKACKLTIEDYAASGQMWSLYLGDSVDVWGVPQPTAGGRGEIRLEGKRGRRVAYRFSANGVVLSGNASAESVNVYASKPVWFEEIALADPEHALQWQKANGKTVHLRLPLGERFEPRELFTAVSCGTLALERPAIAMDELVDMDDLQDWAAVGDDSIPVFADPKAVQPTVTYQVSDGHLLDGGGLVGQRRRVVIVRDHYAVVGWVPAHRLRPPQGGTIGLGHYGSGAGGGAGGYAKGQRRDHACHERLELWVEHEDERAPVGSLDPERPFWVDTLESAEGGFRRIYLEDDPIFLSVGAAWVIAETTLGACPAL